MSDEDIIILQRGNVSISLNMICALCNTPQEKITLTTATNYNKVDLRLCMLDEILNENEYFFICDSCFQVVCTCTMLLRDLYINRKKGNWKLDVGCFICGSINNMCKFKLEDDEVALMVITRIERLFKIKTKSHVNVCWSCDRLNKYLIILYKIIRLNPKYPGDEIAMQEKESDSGETGSRNKFRRVHLSAMNKGEQKMFFSIVKGHFSIWDACFPPPTRSSCRNCFYKNEKHGTAYSDLAGSVWKDLTYEHSYENDGISEMSFQHTLNGVEDFSEDVALQPDNGSAMIQDPPNPWIYKKPTIKHSKEHMSSKSNLSNKSKQRSSDEKQRSKEQLANEESKKKANNTKPIKEVALPILDKAECKKIVGHLEHDTCTTRNRTTEEIFNNLSPKFWMNVKQLLIQANESVCKMEQARKRPQSTSALDTYKFEQLQPQFTKQEYLQTNNENVRDQVDHQINMKNLQSESFFKFNSSSYKHTVFEFHTHNVDKARGNETDSIQSNCNTEIQEYSKEEPNETDTAQEQLDYSYSETFEELSRYTLYSAECECEKQYRNDHVRDKSGSLTEDDEAQDDEDSLSKYVDTTEIKREDRGAVRLAVKIIDEIFSAVSAKQSYECNEQTDSECFLQKESQMSPEQEIRYNDTKKQVRDCFTRLANTKKRVVAKVKKTNVQAESNAELHMNNSNFMEIYQNESAVDYNTKADQQKSKKRSSKYQQY